MSPHAARQPGRARVMHRNAFWEHRQRAGFPARTTAALAGQLIRLDYRVSRSRPTTRMVKTHQEKASPTRSKSTSPNDRHRGYERCHDQASNDLRQTNSQGDRELARCCTVRVMERKLLYETFQ